MIALTQKYQPKRVQDFTGLSRAKAIMGKLIASPYPSAWLFVGDSGTGKTTLAMAVAAEIGAQLIHIASSECNVERVRDVIANCHQAPMFGDYTLVLVDEADRMSPAAQIAWLSGLDATRFPPKTVFIFTCNTAKGLEDRFLSRTKVIEFNGSIDAAEYGQFLYEVWFDEAPSWAGAPMMHKIIAESNNNVRAALNAIELELLCVPASKPKEAA